MKGSDLWFSFRHCVLESVDSRHVLATTSNWSDLLFFYWYWGVVDSRQLFDTSSTFLLYNLKCCSCTRSFKTWDPSTKNNTNDEDMNTYSGGIKLWRRLMTYPCYSIHRLNKLFLHFKKIMKRDKQKQKPINYYDLLKPLRCSNFLFFIFYMFSLVFWGCSWLRFATGFNGVLSCLPARLETCSVARHSKAPCNPAILQFSMQFTNSLCQWFLKAWSFESWNCRFNSLKFLFKLSNE